MNESKKHTELKERAKEFLLSNGFKEDEIEFEKVILLGRNKSYKVDVYARNEDNEFLIECGSINKIKMHRLRGMFDNVLHMPYGDTGRVKPLTLDIDPELWKSFKKIVTHDRTMNDAVVELIKKEVQDDKNRS